MKIPPPVVLAAMFLVIAVGCSGSNHQPLSPDLSPQPVTGQTDPASNAGSGQNVILWGFWDITMNPLTGEVSIVPLRGVQWTVNVVNFMQPPMGKTSNLGIDIVDTSEWLDQGHLSVDVSLTHPFPGLAQYTGADVRGIFITTSHRVLNQNSNLTYTDMGENDSYLANADGYTRWMNPVEFTTDGTLWTFNPGVLGAGTDQDSTLNGYKYFANDLGASDDLYTFFSDTDNLHNRGQFLSGAKNTRRYELYFPLTGSGGTPQLNYQYAVLASWEQPVDLDPSDLPGSFPPDANTRESFLLDAVDNGTLYWTIDEAGGDLILDLEIFNWAPHNGAYPTILDGIDKITLESPQGILPQPFVEFDASTLTALPGTTDASSVVTVEIDGCIPAALEGQEVIIAIQQKNQGYDNYGFGSYYPEAPLTAYFWQTLLITNILPQNDKPIVTAIDPDHGIPDTHLYDVIVTGDNFDDVSELTLTNGTNEVTAVNLTFIDTQHLGCELVLNGLPIGLYDVVAHDPVFGDGILADGFEVMDCPGGIHQSLDLYSTNQQFDPLFVAGVFTSGPYAGDIITQAGAFAWNRIDVADPPADNTPVIWYANKPSLSNMYNDWSWSLDCDPLNEIFAFTTFDDNEDNSVFDFVKVCNQSDGSYVGACDTNCGYAVGQVDVDEKGNIWAVCSNAYYPNMSWTLQRWDYDSTAPAPYYTKVGDWDMSAYIGGDKCVSDIVVLQRYRRLYISMSNGWSPWGIRIKAFDISGANPVFLNDTLATCTNFYGTDSYQEVHQRFVDMEVDRTDSVLAGCRIMVMYMGQPAPPDRTLELRKYDLDLNLINQSSLSFYFDSPPVGTGWFSNFVLDDQNGGRVVAIYDRFMMSGPGVIGVAPVPADW